MDNRIDLINAIANLIQTDEDNLDKAIVRVDNLKQMIASYKRKIKNHKEELARLAQPNIY